MLVRVSCNRCQIDALWTDDPRSFLEVVCRNSNHCVAQLTDEAFLPPVESVGPTPAEEEDLPPAPVSGQSFEIRTLLNVVLGYTTLIADHLREGGDRSQDRFVRGIEQAATRALSILEHSPFPDGVEPSLRPDEDDLPHREPPKAEEDVVERPTVLVVEDDPDSQLIMKAMLRRRYNVLVAASGAEMRRMLETAAAPVRIILMDISLRGEEDGLALTRSLRMTSRWREVPIIVTTAHAMTFDRRKAIAAGCDDYVTKPLHFGRLISLMESYRPQ